MKQASKASLNIRKDDWIAQIVTDPKSVPATKRVSGYIGDSSEENHVRVYTNINLSEYIDIAISDVLYAKERSKEEDPYGGSELWVKADSTLSHSRAGVTSKGKFLEGSFSALSARPRQNRFGNDDDRTMDCTSDGCNPPPPQHETWSDCDPTTEKTRHNCHLEYSEYNISCSETYCHNCGYEDPKFPGSARRGRFWTTECTSTCTDSGTTCNETFCHRTCDGQSTCADNCTAHDSSYCSHVGCVPVSRTCPHTTNPCYPDDSRKKPRHPYNKGKLYSGPVTSYCKVVTDYIGCRPTEAPTYSC